MATLSPIAWTPLPGEHLGEPLQWPEPQVVLVNPDGDLFHEDVPEGSIAAVFAIMALAPQHTYMLRTERPTRARRLLGNPKFRDAMVAAIRLVDLRMSLDLPGDPSWEWPLPNVHLDLGETGARSG
ncbi:DUF5131 family protein [Micromonospora sp. STR1s_5]|nr:DUF5131 family protein [Micromonospora sp. STR1s_5]